jgi:hypothetical protein
MRVRPLNAFYPVLVLALTALACSTPTAVTPAEAPPDSPTAATTAAANDGTTAEASPTAAESAPSPTETIQASSGETAEDIVPVFTGVVFNAFPLKGIRPRIVEISVETTRNNSYRATNKAHIQNAVREAFEAALKRSNITVVSRASNKINFEIKDCRNVPETAECVHIDAVYRSPRFELEVGGYSHNATVTTGTDNRDSARLIGDLSKAYTGAINAVLERLDRQMNIVGQYQ